MANPIVINPTLTLTGQKAAFNASNTGIELIIDSVSFGRAHYDPTGDEVALRDPVGSKVALAGGSRPTPYQLRMTSVWKEDVGEIGVGEIGYWSGDTLVFVWSMADGTVAGYKTNGVTYVLFNDLAFAQVPAGSINYVIDPTESAALAALAAHEGANNAHPQYLLRADVAKDSGPLALLNVAGTANALILTLEAPEAELPALAKGQRFQFLAKLANTGPVTANVEGLGAIAIKKAGDAGLVALDAGDIKAGALYDLNYDGVQFQLGGGVGSGKAFIRYSFVASVAQASFPAPHTPGSLIVLRNGRETTDYVSAADGSKITVSPACAVNDSIEILAFQSFKSADAYTKAEVAELLKTASALPVGAMLPFPKGIVPAGFLEVDGSTFDAATYPDLAAYLGGNKLPESRGEFLRGWDHGRGVDAGRAVGSNQAGSQIRNVASNSGSATQANMWSNTEFDEKGTLEYFAALTSTTKVEVGTGAPRPRNLAVMWCIKAWNAPVNQGTIDVAALAASIVQAKEDVKGIAKVATQTQVDAGASDEVIVTPKKMRWGFQVLKAFNGYIVFPSWLGSLKIQWGFSPSTTTSIPVLFPLAFTTPPFHLTSQDQSSAGSTSLSIFQLTDLTVNGFTAVNIGTLIRGNSTVGGVSSAGRYWLAIGF